MANFAATLLQAILNAFTSFFLQQLNIYLLNTNHILAFYLARQVTRRYLQNSNTATQIRQDPWEQIDPDLQVFSDR